jgi:hypothetical protein
MEKQYEFNKDLMACETSEDLRKSLEERFDEDETRMNKHEG